MSVGPGPQPRGRGRVMKVGRAVSAEPERKPVGAGWAGDATPEARAGIVGAEERCPPFDPDGTTTIHGDAVLVAGRHHVANPQATGPAWSRGTG